MLQFGRSRDNGDHAVDGTDDDAEGLQAGADAAKGCDLRNRAAVCDHAAIRPVLLTEEETKAAPVGFETKPAVGAKGLNFRIAVSVLDCLGCGSCADVCPAKEKALVMKPLASQESKAGLWEYAIKEVTGKDNPMNKFSVKGSQFEQPLLEFSGSCAGCGETPYAKLVTQLFGDRMMVANATGCSSVWSGSVPSMENNL